MLKCKNQNANHSNAGKPKAKRKNGNPSPLAIEDTQESHSGCDAADSQCYTCNHYDHFIFSSNQCLNSIICSIISKLK